MDQPREGPRNRVTAGVPTGGQFARAQRTEDRDVTLPADPEPTPPAAAEVSSALASRLRIRELPTLAEAEPGESYRLRLYLSPRRRPFTISARPDGTFTVVKHSTSRSGNPYRPEALSTRRFRFDDVPTPAEVADELAATLEAMRWWN